MSRPLILFSALLYAFSFPPYNLSFLAWVCLVPLFFISRGSLRSHFLMGWISGSLAQSIIFLWIWPTFKAAQQAGSTTFLAWLGLSLILGLYTGLFLLLWFIVEGRRSAPIIMSAGWVVLEFIRTFVLTGFPWALLSHTQAYNSSLLQMSSITGAPGISFIIILVNVCIYLIISNCIKNRKFSMIGFIGIGGAILLHGAGAMRIQRLSQHIESFPAVKVAILQGNIDQYAKWDKRYESNIRTVYSRLVTEASSLEPQLMVWPESSVPGWIPNDPFYAQWVTDLVRASSVPHLVGAVSAVGPHDYNAAFLYNADGVMNHRYYKTYLVPFGEYIPFGDFLKRWVPYLGDLGIFKSGEGPTQFYINNASFTVSICYEAIFPGLVRRSVLPGAQLIANITNDGWFLDSAAPEQHYVCNIFRAVENGRSVIRAANTGISAVIDPLGRERVRSPLMQSGIYSGSVPVAPPFFKTIYLQYGPWFVVLCWILLGFWILLYYVHVSRIKRTTAATR